MPFQLSPGVSVVEKDFTSIVPAVATSGGAFAGTFQWGPIEDPVTITSENELVTRFGKPNDTQTVFTSFFTAANYLSYSNNLLVVRANASGYKNAVSTTSGGVTSLTIADGGSGYTSAPTLTISAPDDPSGTQATATATTDGDAIDAVTITEAGSGYTSAPTVTVTGGGGADGDITAAITETGVLIKNQLAYTDNYAGGAGAFGEWAAKWAGALGNSLKVSMADSQTYTGWAYEAEFDSAPGTSTHVNAAGGSNDELHIIVIDEDGYISGTAGTILEKFAFVSKASDAKKADGANNYYRDVINATSRYIWWMDHTTSVAVTTGGAGTGVAWGLTSADNDFKDMSAVVTQSLTGGTDDFATSDGNLQTAFSIFDNSETYDISLIMLGKASSTVATHVINNVAETRLDAIAFVSPEDNSTGDVITDATSTPTTAINTYRDALPSSSYAVVDSGYKYQYDRYNDKYRYVPLNGDVAGLCARTDYSADPWFSPAGYNRGQVKNVVKLAFTPNKTARDALYKNGVNPVVTFPGQGTVLFGDKTALAKPSAFDRINVRRLFIVLEKAISVAAKYQLFEFNDSFTRAQFKNLVEPFLRDVQGRRGITDFAVVCDETNNTAEVIDRNEFACDIFIKPNRSINFINLTFVAARSGVSFEEIGG